MRYEITRRIIKSSIPRSKIAVGEGDFLLDKELVGGVLD
jgi:hypothetical protein